MKASRVKGLAALPCALSRVCLLARAAGALVPAALLRRPPAPEEEGDPKPKARGNLELDVRKPSSRRGGCRQKPGAGARAAASPEASPLRGLQCSEEALPGRFSAPAAEERFSSAGAPSSQSQGAAGGESETPVAWSK